MTVHFEFPRSTLHGLVKRSIVCAKLEAFVRSHPESFSDLRQIIGINYIAITI